MITQNNYNLGQVINKPSHVYVLTLCEEFALGSQTFIVGVYSTRSAAIGGAEYNAKSFDYPSQKWHDCDCNRWQQESNDGRSIVFNISYEAILDRILATGEQ